MGQGREVGRLSEICDAGQERYDGVNNTDRHLARRPFSGR
jgi:hypothetical protein